MCLGPGFLKNLLILQPFLGEPVYDAFLDDLALLKIY